MSETGHIIVCGLHGEGLRTIEQLYLAGVRVVVLDDRPDPRLLRVVRDWDIRYVDRDPRLPDSLTEAGLDGAAALVAVQEHDLHTLETALLARELRPDLRVVVQMRNPAVGRAVEESGVAVLDVAGLSAPALVEACLQTGSHEVEIQDHRFLVKTVTATGRGTMRALYGDLAPVAVQPVGEEVVVCPGRDQRVKPGDVVTVLGTPAQLREMGVLPPLPDRLAQLGARSGRGPRYDPDAVEDASKVTLTARLRTLTRSVASAADRRIWAVLGLLVVLVVASTTVLHLGYRDGRSGMSVLDGLYFTVETIGTVGYGDFYFRDQETWLRLFAVGLMIVGAIMATAFFALLTNVLVSQQIEEQLGRLRVTRLHGHVVVIGLGSIGIRVVELLVGAGTQVVAVEPDLENRYLTQARALGVPVVAGDATQPEVLESVHLTHAKAVAVLTSDDLVNIETGLAVRDVLGPGQGETPVVLRLFDQRLARTLKHSFGFTSVRSTAALAAPWFVGAALGLDVLGTFYVGETPLLIASLQVSGDGTLAGLAMVDLAARTRVVALRHSGGGLEYPPRRDTRFQAGDTAYVIGPYEELLQVLRHNTVPSAAADPG